MNPFNCTAHPVPPAPFDHPAFTRDEQRTLAANLKDTFPPGALTFKCIGNEFIGTVRVDGALYECKARSPLQLLTYLSELNLARRTRAA